MDVLAKLPSWRQEILEGWRQGHALNRERALVHSESMNAAMARHGVTALRDVDDDAYELLMEEAYFHDQVLRGKRWTVAAFAAAGLLVGGVFGWMVKPSMPWACHVDLPTTEVTECVISVEEVGVDD